MTTAVIAMTVGFISTFSLDASAQASTGTTRYTIMGEDGVANCKCDQTGKTCRCITS